MFTGIITDIGRVRRIRQDALVELTIATRFDTAAISIGASIACSGPCLTVIATEEGAFTVQASAETLARTTIGGWAEGTQINLEQALRLGDELGGHLVSGHVDGLATDCRTTARGRVGSFCLRGARAADAVRRDQGLGDARRRQPDGE